MRATWTGAVLVGLLMVAGPATAQAADVVAQRAGDGPGWSGALWGLAGLVGMAGMAGLKVARRREQKADDAPSDPLDRYPSATLPCVPNADAAHTPLMMPAITPETAGPPPPRGPRPEEAPASAVAVPEPEPTGRHAPVRTDRVPPRPDAAAAAQPAPRPTQSGEYARASQRQRRSQPAAAGRFEGQVLTPEQDSATTAPPSRQTTTAIPAQQPTAGHPELPERESPDSEKAEPSTPKTADRGRVKALWSAFGTKVARPLSRQIGKRVRSRFRRH